MTASASAFKVHYSSYCDEDDSFEADPDDTWSRPNTSTSHSIEGISLVLHPKNNAFDATGPFMATSGQVVYLVWATYSTGDSFGHDQGQGIEFISVFASKEKAMRCQAQLKAHTDLCNRGHAARYKNEEVDALSARLAIPLSKKKVKDEWVWDLSKWDYNSTAHFQDENDELQTLYVPWIGYFESLDSLEVVEMTVKPDQALASKISKRKIK